MFVCVCCVCVFMCACVWWSLCVYVCGQATGPHWWTTTLKGLYLGLARTIFIYMCLYGILYVYIYSAYTVFLTGKSPNIRSYTIHIYGSGQPYRSPMHGINSVGCIPVSQYAWTVREAACHHTASHVTTLHSTQCLNRSWSCMPPYSSHVITFAAYNTQCAWTTGEAACHHTASHVITLAAIQCHSVLEPRLKLHATTQQVTSCFWLICIALVYVWGWPEPCIPIRTFGQGNHQIHGHIRRIHTVPANPTNVCRCAWAQEGRRRAGTLLFQVCLNIIIDLLVILG